MVDYILVRHAQRQLGRMSSRMSRIPSACLQIVDSMKTFSLEASTLVLLRHYRPYLRLLSHRITLDRSKALFAGKKMEDFIEITDLQVVPCVNSRFIQPSRVLFKQNGIKRAWDYLTVHDSVACLVFNTTRQAFILVKQFRPAVYMHVNRKLHKQTTGSHTVSVSTEDPSIKALAPPCAGITYELCAGIVDQNISLTALMKQELLEECGYDVPEDNIQKISKFRGGVGSTGSLQTIFFAEVTDQMIVDGAGGGNLLEGERIEVFYLPLAKSHEFIFDETKEKPVGLLFAFMWYFNKFKVSV